MEFIRTLNFARYDPRRKRFTSDSFSNWRGSISVFDAECAKLVTVGGICAHIERFYKTTIDEKPFAFWSINADALRDHFGNGSFALERKPSDRGDDCHYNIQRISDNRARNFVIKYCRPPSVFLCIDSECMNLTDEQYENLCGFIQTLSQG